MSLLCDACWKSKDVHEDCLDGQEPVRVGGSCEFFEPTLETIFGRSLLHRLLEEGGPLGIAGALVDFCRSNGYPEQETKRALETLALLPQTPEEALDEGACHCRRLLLELYRAFLREEDRSPPNFAKVLLAFWLSTIAAYTPKGEELEVIQGSLSIVGKWLAKTYSGEGLIEPPTIRIVVEDAPKKKRH